MIRDGEQDGDAYDNERVVPVEFIRNVTIIMLLIEISLSSSMMPLITFGMSPSTAMISRLNPAEEKTVTVGKVGMVKVVKWHTVLCNISQKLDRTPTDIKVCIR